MFIVLFLQQSTFRRAGHSVQSSVFLVERNCPLHIIEDLSNLDKNFSIASILEKCIQTVHELVVETESVQFLLTTLQCLILVYCDIYNWVGSTPRPRCEQYSNLCIQCMFHMCLQMTVFRIICFLKRLFFEKLAKKLGTACSSKGAI